MFNFKGLPIFSLFNQLKGNKEFINKKCFIFSKYKLNLFTIDLHLFHFTTYSNIKDIWKTHPVLSYYTWGYGYEKKNVFNFWFGNKYDHIRISSYPHKV